MDKKKPEINMPENTLKKKAIPQPMGPKAKAVTTPAKSAQMRSTRQTNRGR